MNPLDLIAPNELVICKACNYVMGKDELKDKCPACGVAAKMFIPYEEKISRTRKIALALDLHPILVHFPQAFTFTVLALALISIPASGWLWKCSVTTVQTLSILLPLTLITSIAAGLFDGKIRFRKVTTPLLLKKIYLSIAFLLLSLANVAVILTMPLTNPTMIVIAALMAGCAACGSVLGLMGVKLLNAKFNG